MNLNFHSDQCENQVFPGLCAQQVGGQYEILGIRLKTTCFNDSESTFFERQ